jgi:uncharacterized membrane protein YphA (DoxX/SURF4 family)
MKILLNSTRFAVGVLFIFSGLIKANDPLGLSYKMQEFFEVWNFHWLDSYTLSFSIIMIVFEIVAGVAVLLGWQMRLFSWLLLLLIIFFTFLTGYAYLSGKVRECGCFGDCIPLAAGESFTKDLILFACILFLFANRRKIVPLFKPSFGIAILVAATILSFSLQWSVLKHLPVIDCLPYKIGANIQEKMRPAAGSRPDSVVTTFLYNKNGKEVAITNNQFPNDFDDTYKLISRSDRLVRKGNDLPPIKDFNLVTFSGIDTTTDILSQKGYAVFMFVKDMETLTPAWNGAFNLILTFARHKNIPLYFITADADNVHAYLQKNNLDDTIPVFKCDATAIKTAARVNPTMYLLKKGTILNKWAAADFENAIGSLSELQGSGQ